MLSSLSLIWLMQSLCFNLKSSVLFPDWYRINFSKYFPRMRLTRATVGNRRKRRTTQITTQKEEKRAKAARRKRQRRRLWRAKRALLWKRGRERLSLIRTKSNWAILMSKMGKWPNMQLRVSLPYFVYLESNITFLPQINIVLFHFNQRARYYVPTGSF